MKKDSSVVIIIGKKLSQGTKRLLSVKQGRSYLYALYRVRT